MATIKERILSLISRLNEKTTPPDESVIPPVATKLNPFHIPTPRIKFRKATNTVTVTSVNPSNGEAGDPVEIICAPEISVNGFDQEFLDKYDVRIEMLHYKSSSKRKKFGFPKENTSGFTATTSYTPDLGWQMPWPETFWTRGNCHQFILNKSLKTNVYNCYRAERNGKTIPVWEYLNSMFYKKDIPFRGYIDLNANPAVGAYWQDNEVLDIDPYMQPNSAGEITVPRVMEVDNEKIIYEQYLPAFAFRGNRPLLRLSSRWAYARAYSKFYVAFRYIVWDPLANEGKGQIFEGPLSQTVEISNVTWPFHTVVHEGTEFCKPPIAEWSTVKHKFKCRFGYKK